MYDENVQVNLKKREIERGRDSFDARRRELLESSSKEKVESSFATDFWVTGMHLDCVDKVAMGPQRQRASCSRWAQLLH
eukprot:1321655-Amorphochlora_amoeboformis.AAC.1